MSAAVLLSLLEAVTITPMRSAALLSTGPQTTRLEVWLDHRFERIASAYGRALTGLLKYSKSVLLVSALFFGFSMLLIPRVRKEFVPMQDQNILVMTAQTPPASSLETTLAKSVEIEAIVKKNPYVKSFFASIGAGGINTDLNQISLPILLTPRETRDKTHLQVMEMLRAELKSVSDVKIAMRDISTRGLTSGRAFPVSFNITGPHLETLYAKADELMARLNKEGLTRDLDTDSKLGLKELLIKPNRKVMATRGVSVDTVARTLNATVAGARLGRFTSDGRRYDIRVKLHDSEVRSVKDIEVIAVRNNFGLRVPLGELVNFQDQKTYQAINRLDRQRAIGVFGNVAAGHSQGEVLARAAQIAKEILPDGYQLSLEGASAGFSEAFGSLTLALIMGILVAYMILAVQFNSFVHPVSVLVALPFSLTGAVVILWSTGGSLNLFSFIGLIVLMGIAKKNSIMLVEFTNQIRHRGESNVLKALQAACPVRLRPILMTSLATVFAALPLVIGNSIGQETRTPMGLTIIGGTIVSTVFTLFVVPALYLVLSKLEAKKDAASEGLVL